jgi:hypothetical protein
VKRIYNRVIRITIFVFWSSSAYGAEVAIGLWHFPNIDYFSSTQIEVSKLFIAFFLKATVQVENGRR